MCGSSPCPTWCARPHSPKSPALHILWRAVPPFFATKNLDSGGQPASHLLSGAHRQPAPMATTVSTEHWAAASLTNPPTSYSPLASAAAAPGAQGPARRLPLLLHGALAEGLPEHHGALLPAGHGPQGGGAHPAHRCARRAGAGGCGLGARGSGRESCARHGEGRTGEQSFVGQEALQHSEQGQRRAAMAHRGRASVQRPWPCPLLPRWTSGCCCAPQAMRRRSCRWLTSSVWRRSGSTSAWQYTPTRTPCASGAGCR